MIVNTPRELAYAINSQFRLGLSPRPWQIQAPADTLWWLVPSTEWPAYRHGKFVFSSAKDSPRRALVGLDDSLIEADKIFAGVNIEKGYGRVAIHVDPTLRRRPAQIIDPEWLWFTLVQGDGPTRFGKLLVSVSATQTVYLYVVSSYAHDRESDVQPERDAVMFSCRRDGIKAVLDNRFPVGVLRGIDKATDFVALASLLRSVDDYHWIDVYVGTHVARGDVDLPGLYQRVLSPFDEWVVAAPAKRLKP